MEVEYDRWKTSEVESERKMQKFLKKKKGVLDVDDWIMAMESYGIPAERIAEITEKPIPSNLNERFELKRLSTGRKLKDELYKVGHYPDTKVLYNENQNNLNFNAKILDVLQNKKEKYKPHNIVVLDQSAVYPTSGGQEHDTGFLTLADKKFRIKKAEKVGNVVLHHLDSPL